MICLSVNVEVSVYNAKPQPGHDTSYQDTQIILKSSTSIVLNTTDKSSETTYTSVNSPLAKVMSFQIITRRVNKKLELSPSSSITIKVDS